MKRLTLALVLSVLPLVVFADALPAAPYVQVSGHGSLTVVPDMAHITVTVAKTDKDLRLVRNDVERRASVVIAAARKLGVAERDINAANISIQPGYRWQNSSRVFTGQHVSRRIEITLRSLKHYAGLIDALVKAGVSTFSTTLDRSDLPGLRRKALVKAMRDAHARAVALTQAAGTGLGAVYSISENDVFHRPQPLMMTAKAAPAGRVNAEYEPGSMKIDANVNVVYLLKGSQ